MEVLNIVERTSDQLSRQLENLLEWATLEMEKFVYKPISINVSKVIGEIFEIYSSAAHVKQIKLINHIENECRIFAEEKSVNTLFRNLINNAIKFSNQDSLVEVTAEKSQNFLIVHVKDNGIGIPENEIKNIFSFSSEHTYGTSGEKGIGLGLALVEEFTKLNKGTISVASTPGNGSVFSVSLPC